MAYGSQRVIIPTQASVGERVQNMIFLVDGFLRYEPVSSRQPTYLFFVAMVFLSLQNAIETIKTTFFKPAHLRKVSCTRNLLLN